MTKNSYSNNIRRPYYLWCYYLLLLEGKLIGGYYHELIGRGASASVVVDATRKQFVPSRDRIVKYRHEKGTYSRFRDNGKPIEGSNYHKMTLGSGTGASVDNRYEPNQDEDRILKEDELLLHNNKVHLSETIHRRAGQLTSCCSKYTNYTASEMCSLYSQDCTSGKTKSHDSGDSYCTQQGLAFIGISFSVLTRKGNPNSYQLCDQFPMENLIDRDYKYVMSMDEDGWLVGGGYKQFDYSGKMPYIDSSHTELLRIGSMDVSKGGTSIEQVYKAMSSVSFEPFPIYPEYLKGGGGHRHEEERGKSGDKEKEDRGKSGDREQERGEEKGKDEHRRRLKEENGDSGNTPSGDITLIVSVVEVYDDDSAYSTYQSFLNNLFNALENANEGDCVDDHDTDPHVSMARGVKFKSSYHKQQYMNAASLEVAVWQAMYPKGVIIGSNSYASFPPGVKGKKALVGYGNLYFFFDRMNITKAFPPSRKLTNEESYYATLYQSGKARKFYGTVNISTSYNNEEGDNESWEYNPYQWKTNMAIHDQTNGWDLPPNCYEEGETFVGIPLSRRSKSNLQSTSTFQKQFDFEYLLDRNFTYIIGHGTNHGWLVGGEQTGNGAGSLVDKDTAHIPLFYMGTTNPNMGGMSLSDMIKVLKTVQFGTLYIKPAFVFADNNGHLKLQFEADPYSSMGYLYDNLCQMLGVKWNYNSPYNSLGLYTSCAMHAAGDRATYGCGPSNANSGGFCPQMTIAYSPRFKSQDAAASYIAAANNYVDYWRSLYPYGVAVGTDTFCKSKSSSGYKGGCLGLFLNRMDLYYVLAPDLSGAWVEFNGNSIAPTHSPAPTFPGGCDDPRNFHLDKCFRVKYNKQYAPAVSTWHSLGVVGQLTFISLCLLSTIFIVALFVAHARKEKRRALKKSFFSKKRSKHGDRALMVMEERYESKDEDLQKSTSRASRSSRRSKGSKITSMKGKRPLLSAAEVDLGTNDDPVGNTNSALNYDPPKLQASRSHASNIISSTQVKPSDIPTDQPSTAAGTTSSCTDEIDLKTTSSHKSKSSRSARSMTKPISFRQWLATELNSGIIEAPEDPTHPRGFNALQNASTTAGVELKRNSSQLSSIIELNSEIEPTKDPALRKSSLPNSGTEPTTNKGFDDLQNSSTTADVELKRSSSNVSKLSSIREKASSALAFLNPTHPERSPSNSRIIPITTVSDSVTTTDVPLNRTSSHVSNVSKSTTRSIREKASSAFGFLKSIDNTKTSNSRLEQVQEPAHATRSLSHSQNEPSEDKTQSMSSREQMEVQESTSSPPNRTSSHVSNASISNSGLEQAQEPSHATRSLSKSQNEPSEEKPQSMSSREQMEVQTTPLNFGCMG